MAYEAKPPPPTPLREARRRAISPAIELMQLILVEHHSCTMGKLLDMIMSGASYELSDKEVTLRLKYIYRNWDGFTFMPPAEWDIAK